MASLQVNLSTGEVGMAGGGGYFSSNVAVSGVQIADANGDLTNITANTIFASNLNVTGDFVKVTQSAGAAGSQPALTINQETSGDILQLQRSGAAKVTVLENGNLGIGTAAPQSALHVIGSARVDGNALIGDSATGDAHTVLGSASVTYSGTSTALTVNQQGTGKLFEVQDAGTARMTILDGGFVGIGTATPQSALHVIGSATLSSNLVVSGNITATGLLTASNLRVLGDYVILDTISSNTEQMVITNDGTGPALKVTQTGANSIAEFYDDGNALAFKVANDGLIGIGTATPQAKLHVVGSVKATTSISSDTQFLGQATDTASTPSFSFAGNPNTGIFQPAASNLAVTTGGAERLRVLANGNVGIGTTNPLAKLHVNGNITSSGSTVQIQGTASPMTISYTTDENNGQCVTALNIYRATSTLAAIDGLGSAIDFTTARYGTGSFWISGKIKSYLQNGANSTNDYHGMSFSVYADNSVEQQLITLQSNGSDGSVGIGTTNPLAKLHVNGDVTITSTGALTIPRGTTAQRPAIPAAGMIRYNSDGGYVETYEAILSTWIPISTFVSVLATGGTVIETFVGGVQYRVHTFTAIGTSSFQVLRGGKVEYLVIGGGGGGGGNVAGGGGAGGYRSSVQGESSGGGVSAEALLTVSVQSYTVVVGAGGAGGTSSVNGTNGGVSSFSSITSVGGGGGGRGDNAGSSGGSGGGGGAASVAPSNIGGTGTTNQGFAGGKGQINAGSYPAAGGGGAGAVGQSPATNTSAGGDGGTGISSVISGFATFRAGGGGGFRSGTPYGAGGNGGGGAGGASGIANTGGGGGGGNTGASGGSGIVIIRYRI
jgi:hypothetical protein